MKFLEFEKQIQKLIWNRKVKAQKYLRQIQKQIRHKAVSSFNREFILNIYLTYKKTT